MSDTPARARDRVRRLAAAVGCAALLAGCGGGGASAGGGAAALAALPACDDPPAAAPDAAVPDLVLPDGAVVTSVAEQGPLTEVSGYVAMTPLEVRAWYEDGGPVELLSIEDEVFEAELLATSGDRRLYLKALALCAEGSGLEVTLAPAGAADALPDLATPPPPETP